MAIQTNYSTSWKSVSTRGPRVKISQVLSIQFHKEDEV